MIIWSVCIFSIRKCMKMKQITWWDCGETSPKYYFKVDFGSTHFQLLPEKSTLLPSRTDPNWFPLRFRLLLTAGNEVVDDWLRTIGKVTELRLAHPRLQRNGGKTLSLQLKCMNVIACVDTGHHLEIWHKSVINGHVNESSAGCCGWNIFLGFSCKVLVENHLDVEQSIEHSIFHFSSCAVS